MRDKKTVIITVRIDEPTAMKLVHLACNDDRFVSNYVCRILRKHVENAEKTGKLK